MPSAIAFVPSTPLLVPAVGVDSSPELDALRGAAITAVADALHGATAALVVALAHGPASGAGGASGDPRFVVGPARSDLRGFGVDVDLGGRAGEPVGWSAGIGLWLLGQAGWTGPAGVIEVGPDGQAPSVGTGGPATAVVVVADGSAGLGPKAPGYIITGAEEFDASVERALADGDPHALAALDLAEGARVMAQGAPVLAAAGALLVPEADAGPGSDGPWRGEVRLSAAPLGVRYWVALWEPATAG